MLLYLKKYFKHFVYKLFIIAFTSILTISTTINYTECKKDVITNIDTDTDNSDSGHILNYSNLYNLKSLKERFNLASGIQTYVNEKLGDIKINMLFTIMI